MNRCSIAYLASCAFLGAALLGQPIREARAQDSKGSAPSKESAPPKAGPDTKSIVFEKPPPPDEPPPADGGPLAFTATTDQAILRYQNRVKDNPSDYISHRILGEMYERKAKESGDIGYMAKAEASLRESIRIVPTYQPARASLAAILCAQHKFVEGLEIAQKLYRENSKDLDALSTMGDALMETGRIQEAEVAFQDLYRKAPVPEALARLANLAETKGQPEEATQRLQEAISIIKKWNLPNADAWYVGRLGDIAFSVGKLDEAEKYYRAVPQGVDPFHDATFGLSRIRAAQGKLDEAIELAKKAVAIGPDSSMLEHLGDLYVQQNRKELAQPLYDQLIKATQGLAAYRRVLAMFYADHDRDLPMALELARKDLTERQDVHGYDALAWTLYKNGKAEEAAQTIAQAMKLGTRDAKIYYHAGMIYHRLGDKDKAKEHLNRALAINPYFSPKDVAEVRKTLAELGGKSS